MNVCVRTLRETTRPPQRRVFVHVCTSQITYCIALCGGSKGGSPCRPQATRPRDPASPQPFQLGPSISSPVGTRGLHTNGGSRHGGGLASLAAWLRGGWPLHLRLWLGVAWRGVVRAMGLAKHQRQRTRMAPSRARQRPGNGPAWARTSGAKMRREPGASGR